MTKADIISEIVATTGVAKRDAAVCVEATMRIIRDAMCNEENVYLRGFGTFIVKKRAEKTGRNISKNTTILIPAHNYPGFKPAMSFQQRMKGEEVTSED